MSIRTAGAALLAAGTLATAGATVVPPRAAAAAATPHATAWTRVPGTPAPVRYYRSDKPLPRRLGAHARFVSAADGAQDSLVAAPPAGPTESTWQVSYTGFDVGSNLNGPQAQAAFQAAVTIWSRIVKSAVPIRVNADFAALPAGVLGEAGPSTLYANGTSYYASALADAVNGTNVSVSAGGPAEDIDAQFSSSPAADFYYGTDGAPPAGEIDFESVVLHELGHGLGFLGSLQLNSDGTTASRSASLPFIYDRFTTDAATGGTPLLTLANDSTQLAAALQGQSVYWDGEVAVASNGGVRPRLFAPAAWETGSSYSHLDEATYPAGSLNSLMTPALSPQEAVHNPGPVAVGMLVDEGWQATLPGLAAPAAGADTTSLSIAASRTIKYRGSVTVRSTIEDTRTRTPISTADVWLQSRAGTAGTFRNVAHLTSTATGAVFLNVKPAVTTQYRWLAAAVGGRPAATSATQTVRVAQVVAVFATAHTVKRRHHAALYGVVGPNETHQLVRLQREVGGKWRAVAGRARLVRQRLPNGVHEVGFTLHLATSARGSFTYRVYRPATAKNAAGTSKRVRVRIT